MSTQQLESDVRSVLEDWATATRKAESNAILKHHDVQAVIYDVLPPMKYEGIAAYEASWDEWQPQTTGQNTFEFEELTISAANDCAFAYGFIKCGGTLPNGNVFQDRVRATFCLRKQGMTWRILHQHISKPFSSKDDA